MHQIMIKNFKMKERNSKLDLRSYYYAIRQLEVECRKKINNLEMIQFLFINCILRNFEALKGFKMLLLIDPFSLENHIKITSRLYISNLMSRSLFFL